MGTGTPGEPTTATAWCIAGISGGTAVTRRARLCRYRLEVVFVDTISSPVPLLAVSAGHSLGFRLVRRTITSCGTASPDRTGPALDAVATTSDRRPRCYSPRARAASGRGRPRHAVSCDPGAARPAGPCTSAARTARTVCRRHGRAASAGVAAGESCPAPAPSSSACPRASLVAPARDALRVIAGQTPGDRARRVMCAAADDAAAPAPRRQPLTFRAVLGVREILPVRGNARPTIRITRVGRRLLAVTQRTDHRGRPLLPSVTGERRPRRPCVSESWAGKSGGSGANTAPHQKKWPAPARPCRYSRIVTPAFDYRA